MRLQGLVDDEDARLGAYYFPYAQAPARNVGFAIRTKGDPVKTANAVRLALVSLDPELPLYNVMAMTERIERSLDPRRTPMVLSLSFAFVALVLATIGIYGVLACQVNQRTREIGIRMALGSGAMGILRLVLREGALLVGVGLMIGIGGAIVLRTVLVAQLYGVGVLDPGVLVAVTGTLATAAAAAALGPAWRAARVDPVVALTEH
jgi:ABC-type antimicrobial peptide transport system permease subunit